MVGDVLFSTKASSPFDLALVQMRDPIKKTVVPQMAQRFNPGLMLCLLFAVCVIRALSLSIIHGKCSA